jgi:hypothetical protein
MKLVKPFARPFYSDALISETSSVADNEREDGSLINEEKNDFLEGRRTKVGWG